MIRKLSVANLLPGMFVVDTGLDWTEYPYLFADEGELTSADAIEAIAKEGFLDAFVDTERGSYTWPDAPKQSTAQRIRDTVVKQTHGETSTAVPIAEEIEQAREVYDESLHFARDFMTEAGKTGTVDYEASASLVEDVLNSVARNHDALISLTKLRSFDEYTFTHCINVAVLATAFGRHLGLQPDDLRHLGTAALFHDVGKARIPSNILNKPGKLTDQEFEVMRKHPQRSYLLLHKKKNIPKRVLRGIVEHHEKYNGHGYPRKLDSQAIHPFARIIAVADVYDALTSRRVYKAPMMPSKALTILYGMRGKDFHPGHAEQFIKFMGIYPVGSMVRLSNGDYAIVTASNQDAPLRPTITIAFDKDMNPAKPHTLNLATQSNNTALAIDDCVDHEPLGVDPALWLGAPAPPRTATPTSPNHKEEPRPDPRWT